MHIALVNRWYPPHTGFGGVSMYNYYLSRALIKLGHRVTIVTSRWDREVPIFEEVEGVRVHRLLSQHRYWLHRLPLLGYYMRSLFKGLYSLRIARMLRQLGKNEHIDVIEFAEVGGEGYFYLRQRQRRPVVVRCHTPTFVLKSYHVDNEMSFDIALTSKMEKFCIRHADALTAPSKDMAQTVSQLCDIPVDRVQSIPNAIDVNDFYSDEDQNLRDYDGKQAENLFESDVVVLHVGRLERIKGIDVLAKAIPSVIERGKNIRFVFIGAARSDQKSKYWIDKLKEVGGERVTVLGFVEQEDLLAWYQGADIVVVPSLNYESFSYTCAQAMAAGLPVVASRIGGIPETVDDDITGILFDPGDSDALADGIIKLFRDESLRLQMGKSGLTKAKNFFSAIKVSQKMLGVYQRINT